jgi:tRNA A37 threonylcarbamoyladenosine biosynthesis protein TsaE
VIHVDVYRLGSLNEFDDLEVLDQAVDGVLVIEWGDALEGAIPEDHLRIDFDLVEDGTRVLRMVPGGDWADRDLGLVA